MRLSKDFDSNLDLYLSAPGLQDESIPPTWLLSFVDGRCGIIAPSGRSAAVLNRVSFKVFERLRQKQLVRFELSEWSSLSLKSRKGSKEALSRFINIEVIVFGRRSDAETVATKFASKEVFLQDPVDIPVGFTYENPQILDLPEVAPTTSSLRGIEVTSVDISGFDSSQSLMEQSGPIFDFERLVNAFACHQNLAKATSDQQILTQLLEYVIMTLMIMITDQGQATKKKAWGLLCTKNRVPDRVLGVCGNV